MLTYSQKNLFSLLTSHLSKVISDDRITLLAIDGRCTAGKSTLASYLCELFPAAVIHMDDFFLPPYMRSEKRLAEPGANIHIERIETEIIRPILFGERELTFSKFDCSLGRIRESIRLSLAPLTIIEGVYSMRPELLPLYDIRVFLDVGADEQIKRLKARSPEKLDMFISRFIPLEERYFSHFQTRSLCDFYFDTGK